MMVAWRSFDSGRCGNEICHEYPAPGGNKKLVVFQRDCGATTYWSVQARILPRGAELPNESALVLMRHGACLGHNAELPSVRVNWNGEERVTIMYPGLTASETTMSGVHVTTATGAAE
jgi:hypothetical protein